MRNTIENLLCILAQNINNLKLNWLNYYSKFSSSIIVSPIIFNKSKAKSFKSANAFLNISKLHHKINKRVLHLITFRNLDLL